MTHLTDREICPHNSKPVLKAGRMQSPKELLFTRAKKTYRKEVLLRERGTRAVGPKGIDKLQGCGDL